ncbi:hypothetical protein D3C72_2432380 [compost metagenome]
MIGTHGDIMTLMMHDFDGRYGFDFWRSTSMPDIYKLIISGSKLLEVSRLWTREGEESGHENGKAGTRPTAAGSR